MTTMLISQHTYSSTCLGELLLHVVIITLQWNTNHVPVSFRPFLSNQSMQKLWLTCVSVLFLLLLHTLSFSLKRNLHMLLNPYTLLTDKLGHWLFSLYLNFYWSGSGVWNCLQHAQCTYTLTVTHEQTHTKTLMTKITAKSNIYP